MIVGPRTARRPHVWSNLAVMTLALDSMLRLFRIPVLTVLLLALAVADIEPAQAEQLNTWSPGHQSRQDLSDHRPL